MDKDIPEMPKSLDIRSNGISLVVLRLAEGKTEALLLRRVGATFSGAWCQVAGGIDAGERAWETAVRELREETDLVPDELHSAGICEQFYDAEQEGICVAPVFVAFVGSEAIVTLNHEHDQHRWVSLDEVDSYLSTSNQREMFSYVRRHFVDRMPPERSRIDFRSRQAT